MGGRAQVPERDARGTLVDGPIPLYYQVQQELIRAIETGVIPGNSRLPTEAELCARYGVSRPTVRQAIEGLVAVGYVTRRRGKGATVVPRDVVVAVEPGLQISDPLQQDSRQVIMRVIWRRVGPAGVVTAKIDWPVPFDPDTEVVCFQRARLVQHKPHVVEWVVLRLDMYADLPPDSLAQLPLNQLLRIPQAGRRVTETVEALIAPEAYLSTLALRRGDAIMRTTLTVSTASAEPVAHSIALLPARSGPLMTEAVIGEGANAGHVHLARPHVDIRLAWANETDP